MSHLNRNDGTTQAFMGSQGDHSQGSSLARPGIPEQQLQTQTPKEVFNDIFRYAYAQGQGLQASPGGPSIPAPAGYPYYHPGNDIWDSPIASANQFLPNTYVDPAQLLLASQSPTSLVPAPNPTLISSALNEQVVPAGRLSTTTSRSRNTGKRKSAPGSASATKSVGEPASKRSRKSKNSSSIRQAPATMTDSLPEQVTLSTSPRPTFTSLVRPKAGSSERRDGASDVWWAVIPVRVPGASSNEDLKRLTGQDGPSDEERNHPPSRSKPSPMEVSRVACRYCQVWQSWANPQHSSMTTTIREHMIEHHFTRLSGENGPWKEDIIKHQLKGHDSALVRGVNTGSNQMGANAGRCDGHPLSYAEGEFTLEGFIRRLIRWIVVDDQSIAVIDAPELRDLLLYLHAGLQDSEIPKRKRLTKIIFQRFLVEYENMINEMKHSLGRVSFTSDCWSDWFLRPFMGLTAHFCARKGTRLIVRNRLITFRYLPGSHTGENMADTIFSIISEVSLKDKIGIITLDNASNNNTMMEALETQLSQECIKFDHIQNRGRCFPHVVNIAVQTALKMLSKSAPDPDPMCGDEVAPAVDPIDTAAIQCENQLYAEVLRSDPVGKCRALVADCRRSSQRREDFIATIKEGNRNRQWPEDLPVNQLIRDVNTRWSSTFLMIDCVLELHPAIDTFLAKDKQDSIRGSGLTSAELAVLDDIQQVLMIPHIVQQMLSMEKMPTMPNVIPAYEQLVQSLKAMEVADRFRYLKPAISAAIKKIEQYMLYARRTRVYSLAMAINPLSKFEAMEATWSHEDIEQAKEWLREAMLEHRLAERHLASNQPSSSSSAILSSTNPLAIYSKPQSFSAGSSAQVGSLATGLAKMRQYTASAISRPPSLSLNRTPSNASSDASISGFVTNFECFANADNTLLQEPTAEEQEEQERQAIEEDRRAVDREIERWCSAGIAEMSAEFDLVVWWQSKAADGDFPLLYRVALDILPMQASAVPCERVFSSSKHTSSLLRSQISPQLMEICQILKHLFKQQRLDSTGEWCVSDPDILDATDPPEDLPSADSIISDMPPLEGSAMVQRVDELFSSLFTSEIF